MKKIILVIFSGLVFSYSDMGFLGEYDESFTVLKGTYGLDKDSNNYSLGFCYYLSFLEFNLGYNQQHLSDNTLEGLHINSFVHFKDKIPNDEDSNKFDGMWPIGMKLGWEVNSSNSISATDFEQTKSQNIFALSFYKTISISALPSKSKIGGSWNGHKYSSMKVMIDIYSIKQKNEITGLPEDKDDFTYGGLGLGYRKNNLFMKSSLGKYFGRPNSELMLNLEIGIIIDRYSDTLGLF